MLIGSETIRLDSGLVISGVVILIVLLGTGCLGSDQQHPQLDAASVKCSELLGSGQNMIINETQNNARICVKQNSSLTIELIDASRLGGEWSVTTSPGLQVSDEGVTWYENGIPTIVPGAGRGIHRWNVIMVNTGVQTVNGVLQFQGGNGPGSSNKQPFNLIIVVK